MRLHYKDVKNWIAFDAKSNIFSGCSVIKIKDYSFETYYAFLKYLYTDRIELPLKGVIGKF